jgi:hypothetical protein
MKKSVSFFLLLLVVTGCATTSGSNSSNGGYRSGRSASDQITKSIECVTVLGLNEALEVHYQSGRIEVITMGGQVDISSGLPVRWCSAERSGLPSRESDNSDQFGDPGSQSGAANSGPTSTFRPNYSVSLDCPGISGSFEFHRDGTSPLTCNYVLANGQSGSVRPILNGRKGKVLRTDSMTAVDYLEFENICYGLFADGQVVVASKTIPVSSNMTCEESFLNNSAPIPFAKSFTCPSSGSIGDLESPGTSESERCVVIFADGSRRITLINNGAYSRNVKQAHFDFFRDDAWQGKFCIVMNRNGQLRSYEAAEYETKCS